MFTASALEKKIKEEIMNRIPLKPAKDILLATSVPNGRQSRCELVNEFIDAGPDAAGACKNQTALSAPASGGRSV